MFDRNGYKFNEDYTVHLPPKRRLSNSSTTSLSSTSSTSSARKTPVRATPPVSYDIDHVPVKTQTERKRRKPKGTLPIQEAAKQPHHSAYDDEKHESEADILRRLDESQKIAAIVTKPSVEQPLEQEYEEIEVEVEEEVEVEDDEDEDSSPINLNKFAIPHGDDISFSGMKVKAREVPKVEEPPPKENPKVEVKKAEVVEKQDEFKLLMDGTQIKFREVSRQLSSILSDLRTSALTRAKSQAKLSSLETDLEKAEQNLQQATENEEFERADELDRRIGSIKQDIAAQQISMTNVSVQYDELERKKKALPRHLKELHEEFGNKLNRILDVEKKEMRDFEKEKDLKVRYSRDRIQAEQNRLRRMEENAKSDYDDVGKRKNRLHEEIDEEITEMKEFRDTSKIEIDKIDQEIAELEKRIQELKKTRKVFSA
jgi:hypothetical protein